MLTNKGERLKKYQTQKFSGKEKWGRLEFGT